jgi:hypothetical protein
MNQINSLVRVISLTCPTIVLISYVSNVAAEHHFLELGSNKMISLDLQSGAEINLDVWDKQQIKITYDGDTQDLDNYSIEIDENP